MLSAFTAEPIVELKQRDKSKIESILAHGDNLLTGLSTGALRIYRVNNRAEELSNDGDDDEDAANAKSKFKPTELLREHEKFSRYKVEQLAIFKEANILISLSGGIVSIHDLGTYELQEQLTKTKGTNLFAATSNIVQDATTNVPTLVSRLAVAVRRRLLLWSWHDGELAGDAEEFTLSNSIKSLTWATGTKIIVGLNPNYVMLDIETQEQKTIVGPGSIGGHPGSERGSGTLSYIGMGSMVPTPLATGLGPNEMLLAKDVNTHFIDRTGEPLGRRQIPWRGTPKAVGYSYPFLLALQEHSSRGVLEVRNPQTLTTLQSIELPSASLLQVPNPSISLAHQGKGFLVASDRVIWRMKGLQYDAQVDVLVEEGQLDEAISLLEMIEETLIEDKVGRLREIKMQKAQKLFDESNYRGALDIFGEVLAPPERVIGLYPELISGPAAQERPESPLETQMSPKENRPASIASKSSITKVKKQASDIASTMSGVFKGNGYEKELKAAVRELQAFLADTRRRLQRFFDADQNVKPLEQLEEGPQAADNKHVIQCILGIKDLKDEHIKEKLLETAKLVDTTLFRAHMFATPSLAGSLFRIANHCDPEVVMSKLEETERYSELIDFLYGKGLHREALERLQKFGQSEHTEDVEPQLRGPGRTISYLQNLVPDMIDLILEFARWPMETKPEVGMEIFTTDTENAESLPRQKVLNFLESIDRAYAIQYLEHIIDELDDSTPELHQRLVVLYLEELKSKSTEERSDGLRERLLTHLRQSTQYSPAKTLSLLPRDDPTFYEATAIIYSKMGQHRQALQIYVFKLNDSTKAEEYCNQIYLQESTAGTTAADASARRKAASQAQTEDPTSESSTIYALLLSLYLSPPPVTPPDEQAKPRISDALSLLTRHGPRLPASNTLSVIPTDLLVKELESYLRGRIRTANTAMNDARVVTNLRKVEAVRVQARLLLGTGEDGDPGAVTSSGGMSEAASKGRRQKIVIDEERVCRVCHKRLGGSVISAFPDGSVVHLGCQGRREQELRSASGSPVVVR
ncbi:Vacuolar morphogenesis protein 6 [Exophiala xenobiotica]|uniref:Vacuolar morphogenesis protein 6 n=1 Tax=Lithohypha guttulata TaxID=1690604 RepID=A0ABR0KHA9_9EURO|nr:Vacuolar morphogenesis protein 6 [Lithohypha guttulata]KAK5323513.1 Vacuolar morphogenesis protein 6 [Exophiala xenobiotica]